MPVPAEALVRYLRRCYQAVDGLWFMLAEEAGDFEQALELDRRVWEVLAKIQARQAREVLGCPGYSPQDLARCLELKLVADGHDFELTVEPAEVQVTVRACPWLELLRKSGRDHLALRVAQTICPLEGEVWCREFGGEYDFEMPQMACAGASECLMRYVRRSAPA